MNYKDLGHKNSSRYIVYYFIKYYDKRFAES